MKNSLGKDGNEVIYDLAFGKRLIQFIQVQALSLNK